MIKLTGGFTVDTVYATLPDGRVVTLFDDGTVEVSHPDRIDRFTLTLPTLEEAAAKCTLPHGPNYDGTFEFQASHRH